METMNNTCTIFVLAIYNYLQPIICQFMTLHTKHLVIHTLELLLQQRGGENRPPNKGIALQRNFSLTLASIHSERLLETHKNINLKIIEKPGHS